MNATALSPNPAPAISRRTMLIAFVFCFLGLLADGVDLMFLAYSLNSLKAEFGLQAVEAVGQEHQVDAVGEQAEEAEDEGDQHGAPGNGRRRVRGKRGCIHYSCSRKQDFG